MTHANARFLGAIVTGPTGPFERGDQDRRGLGLGLYIVREIARAHGGGISVESSDTDGTTFLLTRGVSPAR